MSGPLRAPHERPLFSVDGHAYSWEDVLDAAEARGDLAALERTTRQGLACLRRLAAEGGSVAPEQLRAAATAFRYEHDLLAAEELEAWLAARGLAIADWNGYLRRALVRELLAGELDRIEAEHPVDPAEVEAALPAEAACTGFLARAAARLAEEAALAAGGALEPEHGEIEREIAAHALDWLRIQGTALELSDPDAAREAALCVRVDGRTLEDVAADCGVEARPLDVHLEDAEPALRTALTSAKPGELVGPLAHDGGHLLVAVEAKRDPSADDPELARRAAAVLRERGLARELRTRVVWHERP